MKETNLVARWILDYDSKQITATQLHKNILDKFNKLRLSTKGGKSDDK